MCSRVNFRAMLAWHREHRAELTVAVRRQHAGAVWVVDAEGSHVTAVREKPDVHFVNAGIYLLEPSVYQFIESGTRSDMTICPSPARAQRTVSSFLIHEYWLDIGKPRRLPARVGCRRGH